MSKIIILRGNSGSGKTTIAKALQQQIGNHTMLISQDVIRRDMLHVKDGPNNLAIPLIKKLVVYGYQNNDIVILEGILNASWYQPLFEFIAQLYHTNIFAYYFDLPFEETLKRHQTKMNNQDFGEAEMRRWWLDKDFCKLLNEYIITKDIDKESIVDEICKEVGGIS